MRKAKPLGVLAALMIAGTAGVSSAAPADEGVAVAIVYDTSGSMRESVKDSNGRNAAKYVIANRALISVVRQLEAFATQKAVGSPRKLEVGLFVFHGDGAREAVPFGPFDAEALRNWAARFASPGGNTPLGNALKAAARTLLKSSLPRKHVLIITDGVNTAGPNPATVLPQVQQQAREAQTSIGVHFVAFDVDANQFSAVKKMGATVVGAANEDQLNTQLQFILQRKILLEDEEEAPKAK